MQRALERGDARQPHRYPDPRGRLVDPVDLLINTLVHYGYRTDQYRYRVWHPYDPVGIHMNFALDDDIEIADDCATRWSRAIRTTCWSCPSWSARGCARPCAPPTPRAGAPAGTRPEPSCWRAATGAAGDKREARVSAGRGGMREMEEVGRS